MCDLREKELEALRQAEIQAALARLDSEDDPDYLQDDEGVVYGP